MRRMRRLAWWLHLSSMVIGQTGRGSSGGSNLGHGRSSGPSWAGGEGGRCTRAGATRALSIGHHTLWWMQAGRYTGVYLLWGDFFSWTLVLSSDIAWGREEDGKFGELHVSSFCTVLQYLYYKLAALPAWNNICSDSFGMLAAVLLYRLHHNLTLIPLSVVLYNCNSMNARDFSRTAKCGGSTSSEW